MAGIPECKELVDYDSLGKAVCFDHKLRYCATCCLDFSWDDPDSDVDFYERLDGIDIHEEDDDNEYEDRVRDFTDKEVDKAEDEDRVFILGGSVARFIPQQDDQLLEDTYKLKIDCDSPLKPDTPDTLQLHYCRDCQATWLSGRAGVTAAIDHPSHHAYHHVWSGTSRSLVVHIDGACPGNGKDPTKASIGVNFGPKSRHNISRLLTNPNPTSQIAEIQAAIEAMRYVRTIIVPERTKHVRAAAGRASEHSVRDVRHFRLILAADSAYLVDCLCKYRAEWKLAEDKMSFKNKRRQLVKNSTAFLELEREVDLLSRVGVQVAWYLVPRAFNKEADALCNAALR